MAGRERPRMLLASMRTLLVVAGVLVFLAGVQLFVFPLRTARYFAWTIDVPMTAVFLGAAYWSSLAFEWSAARRRLWCDARIAVPTVFVFTTLTLVATLLHVDKFHFGPAHPGWTRAVTWAWLAIYAVVPVLMLVLLVAQSRAPGVDRPRAHLLPWWILAVVAVEAVVLFGIGVALFAAPARTAGWWPWPLTPLTARAVGAWCLGLGVAAAQACVERDVRRLRPAALAFVVFGLLQAVALLRHGDVLDPDRPVTWVYVAFLVLATAIGLVVLLLARRADRASLPPTPAIDLRSPPAQVSGNGFRPRDRSDAAGG